MRDMGRDCTQVGKELWDTAPIQGKSTLVSLIRVPAKKLYKKVYDTVTPS